MQNEDEKTADSKSSTDSVTPNIATHTNMNDLFEQTQTAISNYNNDADDMSKITKLLQIISQCSDINSLHPICGSASRIKNTDNISTNPNCSEKQAAVNKMTLLHYACKKRNEAIVRLLLNTFNADPNIKSTKFENYPIHIASKLLCLNIIKLLIDRGAMINVQNKKRKMAINVIGKQYIKLKEKEYGVPIEFESWQYKEKQFVHDETLKCKVLLFNEMKQFEQTQQEQQSSINDETDNKEKNTGGWKCTSRMTGIFRNKAIYQSLVQFKLIKANLGGTVEYSYRISASRDKIEVDNLVKEFSNRGLVVRGVNHGDGSIKMKKYKFKSREKAIRKRLSKYAQQGWTSVDNINRDRDYFENEYC